MTLEMAIERAIGEAKKNSLFMAVLDAPIETRSQHMGDAPDDEQPFQYCPVDAVRYLFAYGKMVRVITPEGEVIDEKHQKFESLKRLIKPQDGPLQEKDRLHAASR